MIFLLSNVTNINFALIETEQLLFNQAPESSRTVFAGVQVSQIVWLVHFYHHAMPSALLSRLAREWSRRSWMPCAIQPVCAVWERLCARREVLREAAVVICWLRSCVRAVATSRSRGSFKNRPQNNPFNFLCELTISITHQLNNFCFGSFFSRLLYKRYNTSTFFKTIFLK